MNEPYQNGGHEGQGHRKAKVKVAKALSDAGYEVLYERVFHVKGTKWVHFVDVYLPQHDICIEIDGFSHNSKRAQKKDDWKDDNLRAMGLKIIRIPVAGALSYPEDVVERVSLLVDYAWRGIDHIENLPVRL